jgi:hypothetical protein
VVRSGAAHLRGKIAAALPKVQDETTHGHLQALDAHLSSWASATLVDAPRERAPRPGRAGAPAH